MQREGRRVLEDLKKGSPTPIDEKHRQRRERTTSQLQILVTSWTARERKCLIRMYDLLKQIDPEAVFK